MTASSWRACLRIARRDALRAPGRSLLVLVMVALPVVGMSGIDVLYRTAQLDPAEKATREMGAADVVLSDAGMGTRVQQNPDGSQLGFISEAGSPGEPPDATDRPLTDGLPSVLATVSQSSVDVVLQVPSGRRRTMWVGFDYDNPLVRGIYQQVEGRAPQTADEVAVSPGLATSLHTRIGDRIQVADGRAYTVVGLVRDPSATKARQVVSLPTGLPAGATPSELAAPEKTFAQTGAPVTWQQVLALNEHGVVAISRHVLLHPPDPSEIPNYDSSAARNLRLAVAGVILLVVGLASLEVVLLAGAAFAVGARRQRRALALVSVAGGEARHIRRIVLAGGVQLGAAGAAAGIPLGIALAYSAQGWLTDQQQIAVGHLTSVHLSCSRSSPSGRSRVCSLPSSPPEERPATTSSQCWPDEQGRVRRRFACPSSAWSSPASASL